MEERTFVPVDTKPVKGFEYGIHRSLGGTGRIGVFDTENKFALHVSGVKPVEKSGPGPAYMQVAGWARRKPGDDLIHVVTFLLEIISK